MLGFLSLLYADLIVPRASSSGRPHAIMAGSSLPSASTNEYPQPQMSAAAWNRRLFRVSSVAPLAISSSVLRLRGERISGARLTKGGGIHAGDAAIDSNRATGY